MGFRNSKETELLQLTDHISNFDSKQTPDLVISSEKVFYGTTIPAHKYVTVDRKGGTRLGENLMLDYGDLLGRIESEIRDKENCLGSPESVYLRHLESKKRDFGRREEVSKSLNNTERFLKLTN